LAFELSEKGFASRFEHLGNRHSDRFLDQLIEVEKRAIELCREKFADRRLASPSQAGQVKVFRHGSFSRDFGGRVLRLDQK
jgi:hypothetical protein